MDDAQVSAVLHSQKIARMQGSAQMAVEVYGWLLKYAVNLSADARAELFDIVSKEPG